MIKTIIIAVVIALVTGAIALQYKSFKEWLIWGVTEAETYLGSGTGQLKLKYVYDLALARYPFITKLITFSMFTKLVDTALVKMKEMLESNENISTIVANQTSLLNKTNGNDKK